MDYPTIVKTVNVKKFDVSSPLEMLETLRAGLEDEELAQGNSYSDYETINQLKNMIDELFLGRRIDVTNGVDTFSVSLVHAEGDMNADDNNYGDRPQVRILNFWNPSRQYLIRFKGSYNSYEGVNWDDGYDVVHPRQVVINRYCSDAETASLKPYYTGLDTLYMD